MFRRLPDSYRQMYFRVAQNSYRVVHNALADIFYLPNQSAVSYCELALFFYQEQSFSEMAVPIILAILSHDTSWISLHDKGIYFPYPHIPATDNAWQEIISVPPAPFNRDHWKKWMITVPARAFYHPVKLSDQENRNFIRQFLANVNSSEPSSSTSAIFLVTT